VVWSRSDGNQLSHLIKTFTLENKIFDAIWCEFSDEFNKIMVQSICVLDNISLEILTTKGDHYPIALQFQVFNHTFSNFSQHFYLIIYNYRSIEYFQQNLVYC
jgi:hypothetical protein